MHSATLVVMFITGVFIIAQASITLKMLQAESSPNKNTYNFTMIVLFLGIAMVLGSAIWLGMNIKGSNKPAAAAPAANTSAAAGSATVLPVAGAPVLPAGVNVGTLKKALGLA